MPDHGGALEGCAQGDAAALQALFEAEGSRLVSVAHRILRRRDLAEEAVQDAFVRIWCNAAKFDRNRGSACGWIYRVVRHRGLNMLRDAPREELVTIEELDTRRDDTVEAAWDGLEAGGRLRACLERLEPKRRKAILLAYVLGLTHGEIAGRMHAPLGTVKAWMRRGSSALRAHLA